MNAFEAGTPGGGTGPDDVQHSDLPANAVDAGATADESQGTVPAEQVQPATPGEDQESPQVQALRAQLAEQQARVSELTKQTQAAESDPSSDVKGLLNKLVSAQGEYRAEIASLRTELAKVRRPLPAAATPALSPEQLLAVRLAEVDQHSHYCPACGRLYDRPRECTGRLEAPHFAVEVVPTDELKDPPDPTDKQAVSEYQSKHSVMAYSDPDVQERFFAT